MVSSLQTFRSKFLCISHIFHERYLLLVQSVNFVNFLLVTASFCHYQATYTFHASCTPYSYKWTVIVSIGHVKILSSVE
jgi:hypothetical protein